MFCFFSCQLYLKFRSIEELFLYILHIFLVFTIQYPSENICNALPIALKVYTFINFAALLLPASL